MFDGKDKEKDKFSRFNFDAFPFDLDFGNFVANASIFLGIYRSYGKDKEKNKFSSRYNFDAFPFDLDGILKFRCEAFEYFSRNLLLVRKR